MPWQPELAIGAISGEFVDLDQEPIQELGISHHDIESILERERAELRRREELYRRGRRVPDLTGKTAILVDDGLATGSTMLVAVRYTRSRGPSEMIIAVPVGSQEACRLLESECDKYVWLSTPQPFIALGEWYADFRQVSDADVLDLLNRRKIAPATED